AGPCPSPNPGRTGTGRTPPDAEERAMPETPSAPGPHPSPAGPPRAPRVRVDPGSGRGADLAPGQRSLLRGVGAGGRARGVTGALAAARERERHCERRATPRAHVECLVWLGWKTWRRFRLNDALMINLSRGGARLFLDSAPPTDRPVWVFLQV